MRIKRMAVLLVGHGSKIGGFETAMKEVAESIKKEKDFKFVECAYLEIAQPSIPDAIDALVKKGCSEIRVLPYFLQMGKHVRHDLPEIVSFEKEKHAAKTDVVLCSYLGYHEKIAQVVKQRIREAK